MSKGMILWAILKHVNAYFCCYSVYNTRKLALHKEHNSFSDTFCAWCNRLHTPDLME